MIVTLSDELAIIPSRIPNIKNKELIRRINHNV